MKPVAVVLYDDGCGFCTAWVGHARRRNSRQDLSFMPRSAPPEAVPEAARGEDSVVTIVAGTAFLRSDAVLEILSRLDRPWCWLAGLSLVPRSLRDPLYDLVARKRHRLGGTCRLDIPADRIRSEESSR